MSWLAWILWASPGYALFGVGDVAVVYDPNNYAQAVLQYAEALKGTINDGIMIANQAKALENQLTSLLNEAKNLKSNPLQLVGQIQGLWDAYNTILGNAQGIAFNLQTSQQRFEQSYPALSTPGMQAVTAQSAKMLESLREASTTAIQAQSVYERLCAQMTAAKQALTAAQASQGALQIAQAQAQLAGLQTEQLATLAEMTAATGRVQTEWTAKQAKEEQDGRVFTQRFMSNSAPAGFKPLGQQEQ
jgi:type IV secretion system protein TrbJ